MSTAAYWKGRTIRETFDRWWSLNSASGCHEWTRSLSLDGYGQLNAGGKPIGAHRFAWVRVHGPIPDGMHVLHACDNRRCVNVAHLSLGTNIDNIRDTASKGRVRNGRSKYRVWPAREKSTRVTVAASFDTCWKEDALSACWLWQRALNPDGYGKITFNGTKIGAHKFAYIRAFGPVPIGMVVRHRCDTPSCVNPDHLEVGTQADNVSDTVKRSRQRGAVGERNGKARLKASDVRDIRRCSSEGVSRVELARRYAVTSSMISQIALNKAWKSEASV